MIQIYPNNKNIQDVCCRVYRPIIPCPKCWGHICFRVKNLSDLKKIIYTDISYYVTPPGDTRAAPRNQTLKFCSETYSYEVRYVKVINSLIASQFLLPTKFISGQFLSNGLQKGFQNNSSCFRMLIKDVVLQQLKTKTRPKTI